MKRNPDYPGMLPGRLVVLGPNTWNSVARIVCSAVDPLTQSGLFNGSLSGFAAPVKSGPPLHWLFSITMRTWDAVVGGTLKPGVSQRPPSRGGRTMSASSKDGRRS